MGFGFGRRTGLRFGRSLGLFDGFLDLACGGVLDRHAEMPPDLVRDVVLNRAGVRLLVVYAELRQNCDDRTVGLLALSRQLVNPNFPHNKVIQLDRLPRETEPSLLETARHTPRAGAVCTLTPEARKPSSSW